MSAGSYRIAPRVLPLTAVVVLAAALSLGSVAAPAGAGTPSSTDQAKTHLLVLSDMPHGWVTEKGRGSGPGGGMWGASSLPGLSALASCIGVPASVINENLPGFTGPYYRNKDQSLEVEDTVSVFSSISQARTELASIANNKTAGCMADFMNGAGKPYFEKELGKGESEGTVTVTPVTSERFGPGVVGFVMSIPVTYKGVTESSQIAFVNALKGRVGQTIDYNSYGFTLPTSLIKHLDSVALRRL